MFQVFLKLLSFDSYIKSVPVFFFLSYQTCVWITISEYNEQESISTVWLKVERPKNGQIESINRFLFIQTSHLSNHEFVNSTHNLHFNKRKLNLYYTYVTI